MKELQDRFKATMASYPSGVVVVTTVDAEGRPQGFTATSFTSLSLEPPSVLVCLANKAFCYDAFVRSSHFVVNFIDADESALATAFARAGTDKFSQARFHLGEQGVPVLGDAVATVHCQTHTHFVVGDHAVLVGQVQDSSVHVERDVLVHYRRQFGRVNLGT